MTGQPATENVVALSTPLVQRGAAVLIPATVQQSVARDVITRWGRELGDPAATEVVEMVSVVAASVLEMQITRRAAIDARAHSPLGRRILEALQSEIIRTWSHLGIAENALPSLLLAIERVREAIGTDGAALFAAQLGTEALGLLVEVAHDMHSPLASILFLADTLQRGESGPVSELQRKQLGLICTAALGLSSVGKDIIDLERSELLLEPKPVPFSIASVLESVRDIVRPIAEVKRLTLRIEKPVTDERFGQPVALRRVLLNLTTNALKFTEHGSVDISARETNPGWVEFGVRDSGRGIEPAMMSSLFDPLRQVPPGEREIRRRKMFSNTGLGLAICRKLVHAMGAQLRVETDLGKGTRFYFELELPVCPSRRNSDPERRKTSFRA